MNRILLSLIIVSALLSCKEKASVTVTDTSDTTALKTDTVVQTFPTLTKAWESDTILHTPESVLYDRANNVLYVSNIGGNVGMTFYNLPITDYRDASFKFDVGLANRDGYAGDFMFRVQANINFIIVRNVGCYNSVFIFNTGGEVESRFFISTAHAHFMRIAGRIVIENRFLPALSTKQNEN